MGGWAFQALARVLSFHKLGFPDVHPSGEASLLCLQMS